MVRGGDIAVVGAADSVPAWYKVHSLALAAELIGTLLFSFFGGLAPAAVAAYANGLALAVLVYCTASVSGGHLNPGKRERALCGTHGVLSIHKSLSHACMQVSP